MPTENRSSNTEMVSVPRHWAQEMVNAGAGECVSRSDIALLSEALSQPAQQHQGEPVVLPARKAHKKGNSPMQNAKNSAWNACLNEIAKLGPLYTHADPGEVERLRIERGRMDQALVACANERDELRKANTEFDAQVANDFKFIDDLRAQLAEAQALLRDLDDAWNSHDGKERFAKLMQKVESLSASAKPSALAWACQLCQLEQPTDRPCDVCGGKTEPVATKP